MMWLKACRRCHGDLTVQSDMYGSYVMCIQCGAEFDERVLHEGRPSEQSVPPVQPGTGQAGRTLAA